MHTIQTCTTHTQNEITFKMQVQDEIIFLSAFKSKYLKCIPPQIHITIKL